MTAHPRHDPTPPGDDFERRYEAAIAEAREAFGTWDMATPPLLYLLRL